MMFLDKIYIAMSVWIPHYIVGYLVLNNLYRAFYLKQTGYDKWWLGLLPFGELFYRRDVAGIPLLVCIGQAVSVLLGMFCSSIFWIVAWVLNSVSNYLFGNVYLNRSNAIHFGFIPLYKYIVMWKEIKVCQKCSKVKNTLKKI